MKRYFVGILVLSVMLFLFAFSTQVVAQSCSGTLGDTVLNINFGSGTGRGAALSADESDYTYTSTYAMLNRQYSIVNNSTGFYSQWFSTADHTGNKNGYMMILNCDETGDVLYRKTITALCANTTYECGAWFLNMVQADKLKGIDVNLTFRVETSSGVLLASYNTGNVAETDTVSWRKAAFTFTTPLGAGDVVLQVINNNSGGDGNDVALDDITLQPCVPMLNTFFSQSKSSTLSICQGDDVNYKADVNATGSFGSPLYQWQVNDGTGYVNIAGQTATQITINLKSAKPGIYQYRLATVEASNASSLCNQTFSTPLTITVNAKPIPAASANTPVCAGSTLNLSVANGASYQWTGPAGFTSSLQNPSIINVNTAQAGVYYVTLTSALGCSATDSVTVVVNPKTAVSAGADVTICAGGSTVLNASGGNAYRWFPALGLSDTTIANPVASPAVTTAYIAQITNQYGCIYADTVVVTVAAKPVANAGPDQSVLFGKSGTLKGTVKGDNYTYYWSPSAYLSDSTSLTPTVTPLENITYTLHVISKLGCGESVDSVLVKVYQEIFVPNTFSPNGDGINDTWNITALSEYPNNTIEVYNRYGNIIFRSRGNAAPWDGTFNGQPVPIGTYYYKINASTVKTLKSGWVLVVR